MMQPSLWSETLFVCVFYQYFYVLYLLSSPTFVVTSLEPEWAAAASAVKEQTKGKVHLGAVDATVHQGLASRYGVSDKWINPLV